MTATMRMLPVVWRELGAIARRRSAYWIRSGVALAAFLAMGWVAIASLRMPLLAQGRSLFEVLATGAFAFALIAGIRGTSDALSEEKREGTLGLLFLTDLKGYDVVFGKFVSLSINSVYAILALVPLLAFAFILGGIAPIQFLLMSACLVNTLFFSLAVGIFVSTFSHHERQAMGATLAIVFVLATLPYALAAAHTYESLDIWEVMLPGFLIPSPIYAFRIATDPNLVHFLQDEILLSIAFTHLLGWLALIVASACVASRAQQEATRGPILSLIHNIRQRLAYGKAQHRRALRAQTLDRNAFFWLAGRDRLKRRYAWAFISLLGCVWLFARWRSPDLVSDWPVILGLLWFTHLFFKVWIASEVSARFIEDRRSNALELLLTTSLGLRDFARGQRLALVRQFAGPFAAILVLDLFAAYHSGGSFGYAIQSNSPWQYFFAGILIFMADAYAIHWVAIWRSMRLRGTNRTILQAIFLVVFVPIIGLFLLVQGSWVFSILFGTREFTNAVLLWTWTTLSILYDGVLVAIARRAFMADFREAATTAFDSPPKKSKRPASLSKALPQKQRPRFRPLRWGVALLAILLCVAGFVASRRMRLSAEIEQRYLAIRKLSQPVTAAQAAGWRPSVPEAQSANALLTAAQKVYVPNRGFFPRFSGNQPLSPIDRKPTEVFLTQNKPALKLLEDLPNRKPAIDFNGPRARQNSSPENLLSLLQQQCFLDLEDRSPQAGHSISLLLQMARVLDGEYFGAQHYGRLSLVAAQDVLERAASSGQFTTNDWRAWQLILAQIDPIDRLRNTLILQRVEGLEVFGWPPDLLWQNFGRGTASIPALYNASLGIRHLVGQDQKEIVDYLDYCAVAIKDCETPYYQKPNAAVYHAWRGMGPSLAGSSIILQHILPATDWMRRGATMRLARVRLMQTAAEIEIYRAAHGQIPAQLTDLPHAAVAVDPFTGELFRYVPNQTGYLLYSLGEDLKDSGGSPTQLRRTGGDIPFTCAPRL